MIKLLSATLLLGVSLSVTLAQEGKQSQSNPQQSTTKESKESPEKPDVTMSSSKKSDTSTDNKDKSETQKAFPKNDAAKTPTEPKKENSKEDTSSDDSSDMFEEVEVNDPLERMNRGLYYINSGLDYALIKPLALGYRKVVPEMVRHRVDDFLTNLRSPISFVNHLLQGEPKRAFTTLSTFVINSTFGFLGLYDTAKDIGISSIETNFNETLGRWGIDTGPYLIIPILGSSSFRGAVGLGADYMTDPVTLYLYLHGPYRDAVTIGSYVRTGVYTIHEREKYIEAIEELQKTSEDMYATLRSIYFQRQKHKIEELRKGTDTTEINTADDAPAAQPSLG